MRRVHYLAVFIPLALVLDLLAAPASLIFFAAALGVVPTAALMGEATEELAARSGPGIAGLLNVTFGNAPELIIALFALDKGLQEVVKASIVGSVIGNVLLVLGAAMLAGGWKRERQTYTATAAQTQVGMLLVGVIALAAPALLYLARGGSLPPVGAPRVSFGARVEHVSIGVAVLLVATYAAGLVFSLRTHRDLFNPDRADQPELAWSLRRTILTLAAAALAVAVMSEVLVGSIERASRDIGLSQFFVGAFVVAIAGNAAEHYVAVLAAVKDRMDLAVNIAIGSGAQIALFVAPVLVLLSFVIGPGPLGLVFNAYELVAMVAAALLVSKLTSDGESTWFEGAQLIAVYALFGLVFAFA